MPPDKSLTPAEQLDGFIDAYAPEIAGRTREVLAAMRRRLPRAVEMVYDGYAALAIGFGETDKASDAPFSIAVYPRWVNLCFLHGAGLPDPEGLLRGEGKQVRTIRLDDANDLDAPALRALMAAALECAAWEPRGKGPGPMHIRGSGGPRRARR
jgi:hypothetical protein